MREHNPNAYIVCAYGVMDDPLAETEEAQIERFKSELDDNIEFVRLPVQQEADGNSNVADVLSGEVGKFKL